jgi:hypothetical protein
MILEYQQEQQEPKPVYVDPLMGDEFFCYPSVNKLDPTLLQVYAPVAHATLGAPVVVLKIYIINNKLTCQRYSGIFNLKCLMFRIPLNRGKYFIWY